MGTRGLLPSATKLGQGYVLHVSVILFTEGGGGLPQCMLGYHPQQQVSPPWQGRPPPSKETPLARQTPLRSACWEIWSTSGRYASYWNAILVFKGCTFNGTAKIKLTILEFLYCGAFVKKRLLARFINILKQAFFFCLTLCKW